MASMASAAQICAGRRLQAGGCRDDSRGGEDVGIFRDPVMQQMEMQQMQMQMQQMQRSRSE